MRRLVVALDYGTSNSGAAYAIVPDDDKYSDSTSYIDVIRDWPRAAAGRDGSEKVSSEIAYGKDGRPVGHGFEASRQKKAVLLQWVKLLLEPDSFKEENSDRTSRVWNSYYALGPHALQKSPVDVVADYLRWLWKRVRAAIIEKEDADAALFAPEYLTVVLTVPASWSAPARQRMSIAAVIAGIPEACIKTLTEPEAAAVYGLKKKAQQKAIEEGDCVLILDAGGGTVDAVAYRIRKRYPLSLDQITGSDGNFCGSSFVNKQFRSQIEQMLGDKYDALSQRTKQQIDDAFEFDIKRPFNPSANAGDVSSEIPVDGLEDDEDLDIQDGWMTVDPSIVETAFDSVMPQIMGLIDGQLKKMETLGVLPALKGLLLVGGFGNSNYLRHRIRQEFSEKNGMKVWTVDSSWTAVVQGAVDWEVSSIWNHALIHSRISGYNYGIPFVQHGERKVIWLVRKGATVQSDMPTKAYGLHIDYEPWLDSDPTCLVYVPIVISSEDGASDAYTDKVTPHVEIECRVPTDLRFAPESTELFAGPKQAWHVPATLVLYSDGALISFKCKIGDLEVGVASVRYLDFQYGEEGATEQDLRSDSLPSLHASLDQDDEAVRIDSKVSCANDGSSEENILASPSRPSRHQRFASAPAALDIKKETAPSVSPSSLPPPSLTQQPPPKSKAEKKTHHHFFRGLRTLRDTQTKAHSPFLGPSAASERPVDERLRVIYRKGWAPRSDYAKGRAGNR